jgi:hypothetical protein
VRFICGIYPSIRVFLGKGRLRNKNILCLRGIRGYRLKLLHEEVQV